MRITQYKYLVAILLFILSILVSCVIYVVKQDYASLGLLGAFTGFFTFMALDRIEHTARLEQLVLHMDSQGPHAALARAIVEGRSKEITRMTSTQAQEYLLERIKHVRRMYNSSFTVSDSVLTAPYKKWLKAIADQVVHRGVIIEEVVSSVERLTWIREQIGEPNSRKGEYTAYVLDVSKICELPYIETCVLENTDNTFEVLFGWTSHARHYKGDDVFLSRDENLAKFFLNYFMRLERLGTRDGAGAAA